MADFRDLLIAMDISSIRLTTVEEQIVLSELSRIEKSISDFVNRDESRKESREPYEFT